MRSPECHQTTAGTTAPAGSPAGGGVPRRRVVAAVLAGGTGTRLAAGLPKQFVELAGKPILAHCLDAFERAPEVDQIVVVTAHATADRVAALVEAGGYRKVSRVVPGGAARRDSSAAAVAAVLEGLEGLEGLGGMTEGMAEREAGDRGTDPAEPHGCDVLLHDAARPFVDGEIIARCVAALATAEAVAVAIPSSDTILLSDRPGPADPAGRTAAEPVVARIPDRVRTWRAQTPQGFRLAVIAAAHRRAAADPHAPEATDDCGLVARYVPGVPIRIVPGSERNIKITHPLDLVLAAHLAGGAEPAGVPG